MSHFSKYLLSCPKEEISRTGLDQHEGEHSFLGGPSLNHPTTVGQEQKINWYDPIGTCPGLVVRPGIFHSTLAKESISEVIFSVCAILSMRSRNSRLGPESICSVEDGNLLCDNLITAWREMMTVIKQRQHMPGRVKPCLSAVRRCVKLE